LFGGSSSGAPDPFGHDGIKVQLPQIGSLPIFRSIDAARLTYASDSPIRHTGEALMKIFLRWLILGFVFASGTGVAIGSSADSPHGNAADANADAPISPEAQAVMDHLSAYLRTLKSFSIESSASRDEVVEYGFKLQHNESSVLTVSMPDKLRAEVRGDGRDRTFVYDGKTLVIFSPGDSAYVRLAAPSRLTTLADDLLTAGVEMPMIDVLYEAGSGTLTGNVDRGVLVGDALVDGSECDHLAFRQANIDWQIWVQKGDQPLLRRLAITTRFEQGEPQFETTLRWNLHPKIDATTFVFAPPAGANEIPFANKAAFESSAP
jgi:hypothetical protein